MNEKVDTQKNVINKCQTNLKLTPLTNRGLLNTWSEDWIIFFPNSVLLDLAKDGFTII